MFQQKLPLPETSPGAGSQGAALAPQPWRTLAVGARGGEGRGWREKGRRGAVLKPGALICMMLVRCVLWPDIFCDLEANRKVWGCLTPG